MIHKRVTKVLKHTFIPHSENDYKPHFFREHVILTLLISSILLLLISFTTYIVIRTTTFGSSAVSSVLIDLTNKARNDNDLPPLLFNQQLYSAAKMKGEDMLNRNYYAHFAPDGTSPWHWFNLAGYTFIFAGENLAINYRSSTEVEKAWMNSPKHRANILDTRYEDIGIATVPGVVNGRKVLFVVQMFGKPEKINVPTSLLPARQSDAVNVIAKIIFNTSYYINSIYMALIGILIVALCLMIFIEIKKQHIYHILYGVLLIIIVCICIGINSLLI